MLPEALARGRCITLVGEIVEMGELVDLQDKFWYGDIDDRGSMVTGGSESGMKPAILVGCLRRCC